MPEFKQCPACGFQLIKTFTYPEGNICCCPACSLQWGNRNQEMFTNIVANPDSFYMNPGSIKNQKSYRPYRAFFDFVVKYTSRQKLRIFDIGCGNGNFVEVCLDAGHEVLAIEPDPSLARYMSSRVKDRVRFVSAEELGEQKGCFDLITCWDSFEHINDPFTIIRQVSSNLAADGLIFMRVNNRYDIYNICVDLACLFSAKIGGRLLKGCFNFPDHVWNFAFEPMKSMLNKAGFTIVLFRPDDTPAERLTSNRFLAGIFRFAYMINRAIGGGKSGEYFIKRSNG